MIVVAAVAAGFLVYRLLMYLTENTQYKVHGWVIQLVPLLVTLVTAAPHWRAMLLAGAILEIVTLLILILEVYKDTIIARYTRMGGL